MLKSLASLVPTVSSDATWPLILSGAVNVLIAMALLCAGWLLSRWAHRLTREGLRRVKYIDPTLKPLTASVVRYAIIIVTVIVVLQQFGVQTTSLIALLGAAGIAIGLAIQSALSNLASGAMLLSLRPFRVSE